MWIQNKPEDIVTISFPDKQCLYGIATDYSYPINMFTVTELKEVLERFKDNSTVVIEEEDGNYKLVFDYYRILTEEDATERKRQQEEIKKEQKEAFYRTYLKLKKEFEPNVI